MIYEDSNLARVAPLCLTPLFNTNNKKMGFLTPWSTGSQGSFPKLPPPCLLACCARRNVTDRKQKDTYCPICLCSGLRLFGRLLPSEPASVK